MRQFKIVVEKHSEGYTAYPLGLKGVVAGEGDTYEEALSDAKSAIRFHIETFGEDVITVTGYHYLNMRRYIMSTLTISSLRYLTDERGKPQEVVLPLKIWKGISEELEVLREKQSILLGLQQACRDVKMQRKGKLPEKTLEEFLDEL